VRGERFWFVKEARGEEFRWVLEQREEGVKEE